MELEFLSDGWVSALSERLNNSKAFKDAGKGWNTTIALALLPDPEKGVAPCGMVLDLADGTCRAATRLDGAGPYEAEYVIRGVAGNWRQLLEKAIFPVPAIMKGDLQLVKGGTTALMMKMNAVQAMLDEAGALATRYPS